MNNNNKRTFKAALFDLDGTLFDTEGQYTIFWGKTCRQFRPDIPGLEYKIKGMTLVQIYERFFPDPAVQEQITEGLNAWERQMDYRWIPGALEFVTDCHRHGVQCAIVTSSNLEKMRSVALQMPEFDTLFDRVLTSEDFTASKPAPDCYLQAAAAFGRELEECVVFEDAFNGLRAGQASGIYTIGVATYLEPDEIRALCDHVVPDFTVLDYHRIEQLIQA